MNTVLQRCTVLLFVAGLMISSGISLKAAEADDQFAVASGHYDNQRWKFAVEEFQTFLKKYPDDPRAGQGMFFLGEALLQLGKNEEARQYFQTYAARDPQGKYAKPALFRLGEAAYLAGKYDAAKPVLEQFLKKYPDDRMIAFVLPYLGDIALAGGDVASAAGYYQDGLKRFPEGALQDDCRLGIAKCLEKQNKKEEAERLYRELAAKAKSNLADAALFHLGAMQYAAGNNEKAVETFSDFERRWSDSVWLPNARLGLGLALLKLNRPDEADKSFGAVLESKSAGESLWQQALYGKIHVALQKKDHAAVDLLSAEFGKRFPNSSLNGGVQRAVARSLVERKEFERAAALLEAILGKETSEAKDLNNRYMLALCYEGMKRYEAALAVLLPVADNAQGQLKADAQLVQGSLLLALKKYQEAIAPLESYLTSKPDGDDRVKALCELAICSARTGRIDKAKQFYAELVKNHSGHPLLAPTIEQLAEAVYDANDPAWSEELSSRLASSADAEYELKGKMGLGWSQYKAGKLADAAATFDEVLKKNPPEEIAVEAALIQGHILEEQGQNEPALAMYDLVVEKYPNNKRHDSALWASARLYDKLKQGRQATERYEAILKKNPQSQFWAEAASWLAQQAFDAKDYDRAASLVKDLLATKTEPQVRQFAMYLNGQIAMAKGDWPRAKKVFESLVKEFPDPERQLARESYIAEACYRAGEFKEAGKRFERLAEQMPKTREPWMGTIPLRRAQMLTLNKQFGDAFAIASKIEKEFPGFQQQYEADYVVGRCLANQADFDGARTAYAKVIHSAAGAKTETAAMAQWMIGESYFHQKNYETACKEYLKLKTLYAYPEWQAAALLQAGKCYALMGEKSQAAKLYRQVVKDYPQTAFVKEASAEAAKISPSPANL